MSQEEAKRGQILERLKVHKITPKQASDQLGVSPRQVRRLVKRYQTEWMEGLISKKRGKPSNRPLLRNSQKSSPVRVVWSPWWTASSTVRKLSTSKANPTVPRRPPNAQPNAGKNQKSNPTPDQLPQNRVIPLKFTRFLNPDNNKLWGRSASPGLRRKAKWKPSEEVRCQADMEALGGILRMLDSAA